MKNVRIMKQPRMRSTVCSLIFLHRFVRLGSIFTVTFLAACSTFGSERVAFVVGNDAYIHGSPLRNAVSDSRLISKALAKCGFTVISIENANIEKFYEGLDQFKQKCSTADVGLIYYAGHGIEVDGQNYLLPVDANLESRSQLRTQAIELSTVLRDMEDSKLPVKLAILDCCRDNPLKRSWIVSRTASKGLGELKDESLPEVSMIMYSARPGEVAYDGEGANSPFSTALAARLVIPGQSVFDAFYDTADDVVVATGKKQEPWVKADGSAQAFRRLILVPVEVSESQKKIVNSDPIIRESNLSVVPTTQIGSSVPALGESIGNQEANDPILLVGPPFVPTRGHFLNSEVFGDGRYSSYNDYAKKGIISKAQSELDGAGKPDGKMGGNTQAAIIAFQASRSLSITGLLDAATLSALGLANIAEATPAASKKGPSSGSGRSYSKSGSKKGGGGSLEGRAAAAAARAVLGF